mmetsp:Transcript_93612/g.302984  ORF Transcript_93612/g.302984 Transcript_93612/m.302984 type:complete len:821 (-) Transcript_93612:1004-3466(-)
MEGHHGTALRQEITLFELIVKFLLRHHQRRQTFLRGARVGPENRQRLQSAMHVEGGNVAEQGRERDILLEGRHVVEGLLQVARCEVHRYLGRDRAVQAPAVPLLLARAATCAAARPTDEVRLRHAGDEAGAQNGPRRGLRGAGQRGGVRGLALREEGLVERGVGTHDLVEEPHVHRPRQATRRRRGVHHRGHGREHERGQEGDGAAMREAIQRHQPHTFVVAPNSVRHAFLLGCNVRRLAAAKDRRGVLQGGREEVRVAEAAHEQQGGPRLLRVPELQGLEVVHGGRQLVPLQVQQHDRRQVMVDAEVYEEAMERANNLVRQQMVQGQCTGIGQHREIVQLLRLLGCAAVRLHPLQALAEEAAALRQAAQQRRERVDIDVAEDTPSPELLQQDLLRVSRAIRQAALLQVSDVHAALAICIHTIVQAERQASHPRGQASPVLMRHQEIEPAMAPSLVRGADLCWWLQARQRLGQPWLEVRLLHDDASTCVPSPAGHPTQSHVEVAHGEALRVALSDAQGIEERVTGCLAVGADLEIELVLGAALQCAPSARRPRPSTGCLGDHVAVGLSALVVSHIRNTCVLVLLEVAALVEVRQAQHRLRIQVVDVAARQMSPSSSGLAGHLQHRRHDRRLVPRPHVVELERHALRHRLAKAHLLLERSFCTIARVVDAEVASHGAIAAEPDQKHVSTSSRPRVKGGHVRAMRLLRVLRCGQPSGHAVQLCGVARILVQLLEEVHHGYQGLLLLLEAAHMVDVAQQALSDQALRSAEGDGLEEAVDAFADIAEHVHRHEHEVELLVANELICKPTGGDAEVLEHLRIHFA